MGFFKSDKSKDTADLRLSDFDQIWSKFCFMDESGSLSNPSDPIFTVGVIKLSQPYYLSSKILYERNRRHFYDEMRFNKLSRRNIDFAKFAVESFFDTRSTNFYSYSIDKDGDYFQKEFGSDPWSAYEKLTIRLLRDGVLAPNEILIVIADHVTVPENIRFEVNVKKILNSEKKRLAIAGVCRFDSKSNDLLQLVDLLIGAVSYDLKLAAGIVDKGDKFKRNLLDFFKENIGAQGFIDGFKNREFNIFVDKDIKKRLSN